MKIGEKEYKFKDVLPLYKESAGIRIEKLGKDLIAWAEGPGDEKKLAEMQKRWERICDDIFEDAKSVPPLTELGIRGMGQIGADFFGFGSPTSESKES